MWGAASATIDGLKVRLDGILREYFAAKDDSVGGVEECLAAVATLESPHFVHEVSARTLLAFC